MADRGDPMVVADREGSFARFYDREDAATTRRINQRTAELFILDAMERWGGEFARALANAARCATQFDYERLRTSLPDVWERYRDEHNRRSNH